MLVDDCHLRRAAGAITLHGRRQATSVFVPIDADRNRNGFFLDIAFEARDRLVVVALKDGVNFDQRQPPSFDFGGELFLPAGHQRSRELVAARAPELEEVDDDDLAAQGVDVAAIAVNPLQDFPRLRRLSDVTFAAITRGCGQASNRLRPERGGCCGQHKKPAPR